jgi:hypothetical protein
MCSGDIEENPGPPKALPRSHNVDQNANDLDMPDASDCESMLDLAHAPDPPQGLQMTHLHLDVNMLENIGRSPAQIGPAIQPPTVGHPILNIVKIPTQSIRHIPACIRSQIATTLANLLHNYSLHASDDNLWLLWCFPKLVLRAPARSGKNHQRAAEQEIIRRLGLWHANQFDMLVQEMITSHQRPRTRGTNSQKTGQLDLDSGKMHRIRTLVEDGAASKAVNSLLSLGVLDANESGTRNTLIGLHPLGLIPKPEDLTPRSSG